jgi:hypothetical protein
MEQEDLVISKVFGGGLPKVVSTLKDSPLGRRKAVLCVASRFGPCVWEPFSEPALASAVLRTASRLKLLGWRCESCILGSCVQLTRLFEARLNG